MNKLVYAGIVKQHLESKGCNVNIIENGRNNAEAIGISVKKDDNISPIFYVPDEMDDPLEFAEKIISFTPETIDVEALTEIITNKDEVLSRVHYILVNSALNEKRDSIVRVPINGTLELHYKIDIGDIMHDAKVPLEKKHLDNLDVSLAELAHRAYLNTMRRYEPKIFSLADIIPGFEGSYLFSEFMVLSNKQKIYGAGAILYEGMHKRLTDLMKGDFVVIPSSIHEVILVSTEYGDANALTKIIRDVNSSVLSEEDILSDRPYKLLRDKKLVEA